MSKTRSVGMALCAVAVMGLPVAAAAQQGATPPAQQAEADLVFEREVFVYPRFERRNPFMALDAGDAAAVRFEQLSLMGILYDEDPSRSVAVLSTGELTVAPDGSGADRAPGRAFYAKVGQTVGNARIIEIHPTQVVVDVEEFGITERMIMELHTRRMGGTQ